MIDADIAATTCHIGSLSQDTHRRTPTKQNPRQRRGLLIRHDWIGENYFAMSFSALSGRTLTTFRAGLA